MGRLDGMERELCQVSVDISDEQIPAQMELLLGESGILASHWSRPRPESCSPASDWSMATPEHRSPELSLHQ